MTTDDELHDMRVAIGERTMAVGDALDAELLEAMGQLHTDAVALVQRFTDDGVDHATACGAVISSIASAIYRV